MNDQDAKAVKSGCIYCGLQRPFNDEHVFPAGLGGDDRTFMLRDLVCEICNSMTFSRLEAGLMRNSPEAFARVHSQPRSRKRRNAGSGPKFQPDSITAILPEGSDAEVEIRTAGQVFLLPQFSLRERHVYGQGSDNAELLEFSVRLDALLSEESLAVVTKSDYQGQTCFDVLTYQWDGICYQEAKKLVLPKPPAFCIWKDQRPSDTAPDRPHRIFGRSGGQVVLRTGNNGTDSQFLSILKRNRQQLIGVAHNARPGQSITGTPIMVQMNANFVDRLRVFAKIGLNLCAFSFGESFVRNPCFDQIKSGILTGSSAIEGSDLSLQNMDPKHPLAQILSAAPPKHHFCVLTAGPLPNGEFAIAFSIRLYGGGLTSVTLTKSATPPMPATPKIMLVDYVDHKVSVLSWSDFVLKYMMHEDSRRP